MAEEFNFQSTLKPVTLEYEGRWYKTLEGFPQMFADSGFVLRGRTDEGEDIHLWTFLYIQRGEEIIVDGDVNQTLLIVSKYSDEEKKFMHDNYYINKGQNIEDYGKPGSITIEESKDKIVWSGLGRTYHSTPPVWRITGSHAGVETDITMTTITPGNFHTGQFETLKPEGGSAGFIMHQKAEGTIKANGKTYKFKGWGVHERMLNPGLVFDRTAYMQGRGMNWCHSWSEGFSFWCFIGDMENSGFTGMIHIDGETFALSVNDGSIDEVEYWLDPKSRIMTPRQWKVKMKCPKGTLESTVTGYARGFYTWIRKHGTLVVNQIQCDSKTTFTHNDGRVVHADQLSLIEHMRTLYREEER